MSIVATLNNSTNNLNYRFDTIRAQSSSFLVFAFIHHVNGICYSYPPVAILNRMFIYTTTWPHIFPENLYPFLLWPLLFHRSPSSWLLSIHCSIRPEIVSIYPTIRLNFYSENKRMFFNRYTVHAFRRKFVFHRKISGFQRSELINHSLKLLSISFMVKIFLEIRLFELLNIKRFNFTNTYWFASFRWTRIWPLKRIRLSKKWNIAGLCKTSRVTKRKNLVNKIKFIQKAATFKIICFFILTKKKFIVNSSTQFK